MVTYTEGIICREGQEIHSIGLNWPVPAQIHDWLFLYRGNDVLAVHRRRTSRSDWSHGTTPGSSQRGSDWCWLQVARLRPTAFSTAAPLRRVSDVKLLWENQLRVGERSVGPARSAPQREHAHTRTLQHLGQRTADSTGGRTGFSVRPPSPHVDGSGFFSCSPPSEESASFPSVGVPADAWLNPGGELWRAAWKRCGVLLLVVVPKRPSIPKDADGKCLETEMTRFVKRRLNSCPISARRGKCRTNTAWILSTISETWPGHDTRIQVRKPCARPI